MQWRGPAQRRRRLYFRYWMNRQLFDPEHLRVAFLFILRPLGASTGHVPCTAPMSNALVGAIGVEDGTHSLWMVFRHEGIGTPIRRLARIRPCVPRIHRPTAAGR